MVLVARTAAAAFAIFGLFLVRYSIYFCDTNVEYEQGIGTSKYKKMQKFFIHSPNRESGPEAGPLDGVFHALWKAAQVPSAFCYTTSWLVHVSCRPCTSL